MIKYTIEKDLGFIDTKEGEDYRKALRVVSWNGKKGVLDIRNWNEAYGTPLKGITLTREEAELLFNALGNYLKNGAE